MPAGIPGYKLSNPGDSEFRLSLVENGLNDSPMKILRSSGAFGRDVTCASQ